MHIPKEKRNKKSIQPKGLLGVFVGYDTTHNGYKVYLQESSSVDTSRDVVFDEEDFPFAEYRNEQLELSMKRDALLFLADEKGEEDVFQNLKEVGVYFVEDDTPITYSEAMKSREHAEWKAACDAEYAALMENRTWDLVAKPEGKPMLKSGWVFRRKTDSDGVEIKKKARFVAKGYSQIYGENFWKTYAPVAKISTLRLAIAIAAQKGWSIKQTDVDTAFLNAKLSEDIYVHQPEGYIDGDHPDYVLKLRKSLYGLKQAPLMWFNDITEKLTKFGLEASQRDPCLFKSKDLVVIIYVDDVLITGRTEELTVQLYEHLKKFYSLKKLEDINFLLGISMTRDHNGTVTMHQKSYVEKMLKKFNMENSKPSSIPIQNGIHYEKGKEEFKAPYRELVGALMYLMLSTRPDIAYGVSMLSRFLNCYDETHWQAGKQILRYLSGTIDYGLTFKREITKNFVCYTDTDWAGDCNGRRSTEGYCIFINSSLICWRSSLQKSVSLYSAEYMGLSRAIQEVLWIKGLLEEMNAMEMKDPFTVLCDNQAAVQIASNPSDGKGGTKHIDIRYHFCKEHVMKKTIDLQYVRSEENIADVYTKALGRTKFEYFVEKLGLKLKREIDLHLREDIVLYAKNETGFDDVTDVSKHVYGVGDVLKGPETVMAGYVTMALQEREHDACLPLFGA